MNEMEVDKISINEEESYNDSTSSNYSCESDDEEKKVIKEKTEEITFDFIQKKRRRLRKKCK
jgi:hypothetical protein